MSRIVSVRNDQAWLGFFRHDHHLLASANPAEPEHSWHLHFYRLTHTSSTVQYCPRLLWPEQVLQESESLVLSRFSMAFIKWRQWSLCVSPQPVTPNFPEHVWQTMRANKDDLLKLERSLSALIALDPPEGSTALRSRLSELTS
jgi:hypothetical protein